MFKTLLVSLLLACSLQVNAKDSSMGKVETAFYTAVDCQLMATLLDDTVTAKKQLNRVYILGDVLGVSPEKAMRDSLSYAKEVAKDMSVGQYFKACK